MQLFGSVTDLTCKWLACYLTTELNYNQVRAPRPPRDRNPNKGKSFPDNYDVDDHRGSSFRQFFAGDGLAAPPPKRSRESQKRRDRDRKRDRENTKDRKRRERNKSREAIQQTLNFVHK